jgi:hypothetical protein
MKSVALPVLLLGAVALAAILPGRARSAAPAAAPPPLSKWKNGLPSDPSYFPLAVWLQNPSNAKRFQAAGINLYVGLWEGPTDEQLAALKAADMRVVCEMNAVGLAHKDDPTIVGWMHGDEPDNAQPVKDPVTGRTSYGPCIPPAQIVAQYEEMKKKDPTRPILLNLGQGVANDEWVGRGAGAKQEDYLTYVKGGDIVSFDVYPVAGLDKPNSENFLWYVPRGVERLTKWSQGTRRIWNCIETGRIDNPDRKPTPAQVRAEVWMSLIHGSKGLIYFVHQFKPKFNEYALLDDPEMLAGVTAVNRQIRVLAPVLNAGKPVEATATSSNAETPIALMARHHQGELYLFSVGMRNAGADGTFRVPRLSGRNARVEVIGESRTVEMKDGAFRDHFDPYGVHLYRIALL